VNQCIEAGDAEVMGVNLSWIEDGLAVLLRHENHLSCAAGSRIHERTIRLRLLGIILRVITRLEVSVYNVYITNQFQTNFAQGEGGE
jgi:hypothetical protein